MITQSPYKEGFRILLWLLEPDPQRAASAYEKLFRQLVYWFTKNGFSQNDAEDLAQNTVIKLAAKLESNAPGQFGEERLNAVSIHNLHREMQPERYENARKAVLSRALWVARDVIREQRRQTVRHQTSDFQAELPSPSEDAGLEKIQEALNELAPNHRNLIKNYYSREGAARDFARDLGISEQALKNRVGSISKRLKTALGIDTGTTTQFTAFYPWHIPSNEWGALLAYMHLRGALTLVYSDANRRFKNSHSLLKAKSMRKGGFVPRGARVSVVPYSDALEFKPRQISFRWLENFHCAEFKFRVRPNYTVPKRISVRIAFFMSPILVGEISFRLAVENNLGDNEENHHTSSTAYPFKRVFVSYSHRDSRIADMLENAYTALGDEYLRDVRILKSGEKWSPALLKWIEESDVFQLLWSKAAKYSINVEQEWRHALRLQRRFFIRPIYWQLPMARPPRELAGIHFAYLKLKNGP